MKQKRRWIIIIVVILVTIVISGFYIKVRIQTQAKELFQMNKTLQEEGYYMAEFEFRMMSVLYYLDNNKYIKALKLLSDYHSRLSAREGLIKLPNFKTNQEEIDFYLKLQNPETGAFIDADAPFFIYWAVTENVLDHIEDLHDSTSLPIKLKHPLKFLDKINTIETLAAHLNDMAYVGWLAPKFPMTSFIFVRGLMSCTREDNVLTRNKLYSFSSEWKQFLNKWMYDFQDAETGMWGPKYRKSKNLAVKDLDNTASLLKQFRDKNGNNLHADFPLRFKEELFMSTLEALQEPFPEDDKLSDIHAWNLKISKGSKMLLRYLWKDASEANKKKAQAVFTDLVKVVFEKFYVESDGAFSYYPNAEHASCDGMTNFMLDDIGALSYKKQKKYWGDPEKNTEYLGTISLFDNGDSIFYFFDTLTQINSYRIYTVKPNFTHLTDSVWAVIYPSPTKVLDITDVVPNIVAWTETSTLSMGNWKSMANIKNEYTSINIKKPLIFREEFPYYELKSRMKESPEIFIIGFDILQIPRFMVKLRNEA